jgi:hypothetical protein
VGEGNLYQKSLRRSLIAFLSEPIALLVIARIRKEVVSLLNFIYSRKTVKGQFPIPEGCGGISQVQQNGPKLMRLPGRSGLFQRLLEAAPGPFELSAMQEDHPL